MSKSIGRYLIISILLQIGMLFYVYNLAYEANKKQVLSARKGCERNVEDRKAESVIGMNMLTAFRETDKRLGTVSPERKAAIQDIANAVAGLQLRSQIDCKVEYPPAKWMP